MQDPPEAAAQVFGDARRKPVRPPRSGGRLTRWPLAWRLAVSVAGIVLVVNGSLRMSDDVWPFGPLSQYAFSPAADATIVITRAEGLSNGTRIDLPLVSWQSGIGRAEVEARIPEIEANPALLRTVSDGWRRNHPNGPVITEVWLVQDVTTLSSGRPAVSKKVDLAHWVVS